MRRIIEHVCKLHPDPLYQGDLFILQMFPNFYIYRVRSNFYNHVLYIRFQRYHDIFPGEYFLHMLWLGF